MEIILSIIYPKYFVSLYVRFFSINQPTQFYFFQPNVFKRSSIGQKPAKPGNTIYRGELGTRKDSFRMLIGPYKKYQAALRTGEKKMASISIKRHVYLHTY